MSLNTIALELVAPNVENGHERALEEAQKVLRCSEETGLAGRIRHVMIPGMIDVRRDELERDGVERHRTAPLIECETSLGAAGPR